MNLENWKQHNTRSAMWARGAQQAMYRLLHGPAQQTRVAMFHAGRCGSSVLVDLLNQHSEMRWANEIFENMLPAFYNMSADKRAKARIAAAIHPANSQYFGFETKYLPEQHLRPELANKSLDDYLKLLTHFNFGHFILLDRKNHLRRAVSISIGQQTQQWHSDSPTTPNTITLQTENIISYGQAYSLLDFFDALDSGHKKAQDMLQKKKLLELCYEDDIEHDPLVGYNKCCRFLGLTPVNVAVRLQRQNPKQLADILLNYEHVANLLTGTRHEWMLNS